MLKRIAKSSAKATGSFAIVAASYNARYVDAMLDAALAELKAAGAKDITIIRVPGAYEVPTVVARLARQQSRGKSRNTHHASRFAAIIGLGLILRGETAHADHIGEAVSSALMDIQVETEVPVIHAVLLMDSEQHAVKRCLGKEHNRGTEAARTALTMAAVMRSISD
jgi:6,7-dimethyl-8-ribityllumazine synthase